MGVVGAFMGVALAIAEVRATAAMHGRVGRRWEQVRHQGWQ